MKQDPKKSKLGADLADLFQDRAGRSIPADLDLWPELRRELERRQVQQWQPRHAPLRPVLQIAGYEPWMEEDLEPNQAWIELFCYKGHEQDAAEALSAAFTEAGIPEQLLRVVASSGLGMSSADAGNVPDGMFRPLFALSTSVFMAQVETSEKAAAVIRRASLDDNSDLSFRGWQFSRNLTRAREIPDQSGPAGVPFKIWDRVRVLTWPFDGQAGLVGAINRSKSRVTVVVWVSGNVHVLALSPAELEPLPEEPKRAWYVLYGYPGKEGLLRDRLRERLREADLLYRLFDIVVPSPDQANISLVKDGRVQTISPSLFPGAVFVLLSLDEATWAVVRQTPGLTGFVGQGSQPTGYPTVPQPTGTNARPAAFQPGDRVRILSGPYQNFRAAVIEVDVAHAKLRVMVDFPGRPVKAEVAFDQVAKE